MTEPVETNRARRSRTSFADRLHPRPLGVALAVLAFLGAGVAGALVARSGDITYGSNVVLAIDQPLVVAASRDAGPIEKLNRLRLQYAALVKTAVVADTIAQRTGRSSGDVSRSVEVQPAPNSLLIVLTGRASDSARAVDLATQSASALVDYAAQSQQAAGVPVPQRVQLSVVSPAGPASRITRGRREVATVGLALGLVAAAAVYVVASLLSSLRRR